MGNKSLSKRSKKSSLNSNPTSSQKNSMAPPAPSFRLNYWTAPLLISAGLFLCVMILSSISSNNRSALGSNGNADLIYGVEIVNEFPHDPGAFTQGLLYAGNDSLFESTGLYGRSSVRRVALGTGKVEAIHKMPNEQFGEGLTLLGDRLFQVTWLKKTGFIYGRNNLTKIKTFTHQMSNGWGLATDGNVIFGSDGSSTLYQFDPQTLKVIDKHVVKYKGREVHNINELEYVNGEVWANVWMTDCIVRLSGRDGSILGWIYLPSLREDLFAAGNTEIDVLNGIAWDEEQNRLFVTGKLWPKLYEVKVQPMEKPFNGDIETLCMRPPPNFGRP